LEAGAGHAFAKAALGKKILLEPPELLVEQVVSLVNEADEDIGDNLGRSSLEIAPIGLIGPI
jgi:hypothetical protein